MRVFMHKKNSHQESFCLKKMVRVTGLEPARPKALDPKSSASANFATPAQKEL
jgi:hypothetical protein